MNKPNLKELLAEAETIKSEIYHLWATIAGRAREFNDNLQEELYQRRLELMERQDGLIKKIEALQKGETDER